MSPTPTTTTKTAGPQPQTGKPNRKPSSKASHPTETQTQKQKQQKEKEATIAVLKKLLEADSQLYGIGVKAMLAYARNVLDARDELKGNGIPDLHFDPWTDFKNQSKGGKASVSKCIAIAEHAAINDDKNLKYLPASISTLYELTGMSVDKFNKTPKSTTEKEGTINPAMTREQAREMVGKKPHPSSDTLKRFRKVVVNGEGVGVLSDLENAAADMKAKLDAANNEDHLDAAKAPDAKSTQAANSPAQEPEEVETLTTFPNVMTDQFFHFDLPVLEDRATTAMIRTRLLKLKAELPVPDGYVWNISLKKTQTATAPV